MWWDDNNDSKDWQIFKNLTLLNFYGDNKDRDEFMNGPAGTILAIIFIIALIVLLIFGIIGAMK